METHGVVSQGLPTMPTPNELKPYQGFPLQSVVELAIKYLPFLGFFLIWAAVQFKDLLKGDFTDRSQVRKKEREDAANATLQQREDDKILGLQKMIINNSDEGAMLFATYTLSMPGRGRRVGIHPHLPGGHLRSPRTCSTAASIAHRNKEMHHDVIQSPAKRYNPVTMAPQGAGCATHK